MRTVKLAAVVVLTSGPIVALQTATYIATEPWFCRRFPWLCLT